MIHVPNQRDFDSFKDLLDLIFSSPYLFRISCSILIEVKNPEKLKCRLYQRSVGLTSPEVWTEKHCSLDNT